jgi:hypothetical protein
MRFGETPETIDERLREKIPSSEDKVARATERVKLKSLILAQIERWRHA